MDLTKTPNFVENHPFLKRVWCYGELVMFSNSIFSLGFGLAAMVLAAGGLPEIEVVFWICLALLGGRTGANAFNRVADRYIDAKDPRTARRHIPAGVISTKGAMVLVVLSFLVLTLATAMLPRICLYLLPVALFLFIFYSYSKRITWLCHLILGVACAAAPAGAWLGVTGSLNVPGLVLAAADVLWIAGFDIIYAVQDRDFDASQGLHSIPVRFGAGASYIIAGVFHLLMVVLLLILGFIMSLPLVYFLGIAVIALILLYENFIVRSGKKQRVLFASYSLNQIISIIFLLAVFAAVFIFN